MGVRDFVTVIRELSFDQLRAEALLAPRLLVIARDAGLAALGRDRLFGPGAEEFVDVRTFGEGTADPLEYDVIVSVGPLESAVGRTWRDLFRRVDEPARVVEIEPDLIEGAADLDGVRRRIADVADERSLAIGRYIDAMREACAAQVVTGTSMVNAQFSLLSNLPTLLPVVGNLVAVGADFLVLTKNQLMMIFKLAAIYQRDLDDRWRIYSEMLPVVGTGLVWRTVARELDALLPFGIGTVPKVVISYGGTYTVGRAADLYYQRGIKVTGEQMRELYAEALEALKKNQPQLPRIGVFRNGHEIKQEQDRTPPETAEKDEG